MTPPEVVAGRGAALTVAYGSGLPDRHQLQLSAHEREVVQLDPRRRDRRKLEQGRRSADGEHYRLNAPALGR